MCSCLMTTLINFFDLQIYYFIFITSNVELYLYVYLSQTPLILSQALLRLTLLPVKLYYLNKSKNAKKKQCL